eukprot:1703861-Rhodomonas_salina.1
MVIMRADKMEWAIFCGVRRCLIKYRCSPCSLAAYLPALSHTHTPRSVLQHAAKAATFVHEDIEERERVDWRNRSERRRKPAADTHTHQSQRAEPVGSERSELKSAFASALCQVGSCWSQTDLSPSRSAPRTYVNDRHQKSVSEPTLTPHRMIKTALRCTGTGAVGHRQTRSYAQQACMR